LKSGHPSGLKISYSSSFFQQPTKTKTINDIKQGLKYLQPLKQIVIFQWVPFHVGLEGNKIAEKLAKNGTTLHTKETSLRANTLKKLRNCKIATKYNQETNKLAITKKWRDIHKI